MDTFADLYKASLDENFVAFIETNDNYRIDGDLAVLLRSYGLKYIISLPLSARKVDESDTLPVTPSLIVLAIDEDGGLAGQDILVVDEQHRAWGVFQALVKLQEALDEQYFIEAEEEAFDQTFVKPQNQCTEDEETLYPAPEPKNVPLPDLGPLPDLDQPLNQCTAEDHEALHEVVEEQPFETDREALVNLLVTMKDRANFPYEIDLSEDNEVRLLIDNGDEQPKDRVVFIFQKDTDSLHEAFVEPAV